jgi:hypothetical protein
MGDEKLETVNSYLYAFTNADDNAYWYGVI